MALVDDFEQRGRSGYYYRRTAPLNRPGTAYKLTACEGCGKPCLVQVGAPARKGRFCSADCARSAQSGERGNNWRGTKAGYRAAHVRVRRVLGKASSCIWGCQHTHYDWANLTGNLLDPNDYTPMCRRCHVRFDSAIRMMAKDPADDNGRWRPWRYA